MQCKWNATRGSWLSAAMSCYLLVVETWEREREGCVMWLDPEWLGQPRPGVTGQMSGQWLQWLGRPDCTHSANQRLLVDINYQSEAGKICTSRQFDVSISLTQREAKLDSEIKRKKIYEFMWVQGASDDIFMFQDSWGPLKRFCTNLWTLDSRQRDWELAKSLWV